MAVNPQADVALLKIAVGFEEAMSTTKYQIQAIETLNSVFGAKEGVSNDSNELIEKLKEANSLAEKLRDKYFNAAKPFIR